jgi:hypothetical protein
VYLVARCSRVGEVTAIFATAPGGAPAGAIDIGNDLEVQRRRPGTRVLYTSGYTENAIMHHGRLDPGVALLNKPYRMADLALKIREVLGEPPA